MCSTLWLSTSLWKPLWQLECYVVTDVVDNQQVNLYSDIFNNVSSLVQAGHGFMGTETVKWWHGNLSKPEPQDNYMVGKGEVRTWDKQSIMPDLIQVSIAWSNYDGRSSTTPSLNGMPIHFKVPPTIRRYPFLLPTGERHCERKVLCLRTQHNDPTGFGTLTSWPDNQYSYH